MDNYFISAIQQVGVGTTNFTESWKWYIEMFQMNIRILEDDTVAERMLPYTGNQPQKRHACIAVNLQGGGGFEIWQYSERKPQPIDFEIQVADLGIFVAKIKSCNVAAFHKVLTKKYDKVSELYKTPEGKDTFYVLDPWNNYFQVVEDKNVFINQNLYSGGIAGAMIGVTDIDRALTVYRDILGYDTIVYDKTGVFDDFKYLKGGDQNYRRVLLKSSKKLKGPFAGLCGESALELVVALDRQPRKIFEGRYWGDPGYIQICFDIMNMKGLREFCESKGFPFTVDSCPNNEHFDMGDASGHFTYIEDPDGTLIEFVETHKIPVMKKLGWNINMLTRDREKPLPRFLFKVMGMFKVKLD